MNSKAVLARASRAPVFEDLTDGERELDRLLGRRVGEVRQNFVANEVGGTLTVGGLKWADLQRRRDGVLF